MTSIRQLFTEPDSALFAFCMDKRRGGKPRAVQADYAGAVEELLSKANGIGLFQGETGSGKTLGYLIPALLRAAKTKSRVIISTQTLGLQRQIFEETLPNVLRLVRHQTGVQMKAARRIGKGNFISIPAFENRIDELSSLRTSSQGVVDLLQEILAAVKGNPALATKQFVFEEFGQSLAELNVAPIMFSNLEIGRFEDDDLAYRDMVEAARGADILIVNHALLATDLISYGRVLADPGDHAPRGRIVVVDEADAFPGMASEMMSRKLPLQELNVLVKRLPMEADVGKACAHALSKIEGAFNSLAGSHQVKFVRENYASVLILDPRNTAPIASQFTHPLETIQSALADRLDGSGTDNAHHRDLQVTLSDIASVLRNFRTLQANETTNQVTSLYWSPVRHFPGFHIDGGEAGRIISRLWRSEELRPDTLLFTSATITAGTERENMRDFAHEIGMGNDTYANCVRKNFAPTSFGEMDFVVIDQVTAPPVTLKLDDDSITNPAIFESWKAIVLAAAEKGGRVLVLMPSYRDATELHRQIRSISGRNLILEQKGQGQTAVATFEEDATAILITPARWAGLDLPGKVRHVVVPRIPLEPPNVVRDAVRESILQMLGASKESIINKRFPAAVAHARRKLLQGIGRGIRVESDKVTVWIGDSRWPLSQERQSHHPTVKTSHWVRSMLGAIPTRFRGKLEAAQVFQPRPTNMNQDTPRTALRGGSHDRPRSKIVHRHAD